MKNIVLEERGGGNIEDFAVMKGRTGRELRDNFGHYRDS